MKMIAQNQVHVNLVLFIPTDVTFTDKDLVIIDTDSIFNCHLSSQ